MRNRLALIGIAAGLVATACGSRLPGRVLDRIDAGQSNRAGSAAAGSGSQGASTEETNPLSTAGNGAVTPGQPQRAAGAAQAVAGAPGSAGQAGAQAQTNAACRGGASAQGVTPNEIKVGTMVTASGPLPGATEGQYRGTAAYLAMINSQGGICGRKITAIEGDDGLDPQRARAEFTRIEPQVFAFVGSLSVADSGFLDLLKSTGIPYLGVVVDPSGRDYPNVEPRGPPRTVRTGPFVYYKQAHPDANRVGFLYTDVAGVRVNTPGAEAAIRKVGYTIAYGPSGANATAPDYTAEVINMERNQVNFVYLFAFEVNMEVRLARNMRQQNFEPALKINSIGYNSELIGLLGDVANGWTQDITYRPVLNQDELQSDPNLRTFNDWNKRVFPNAQVDLFPVNGWGAADLFAKALRIVGPAPTWASLLGAIDNKIPSWDNGGLTGASKPGQGSPCFIVVKVVNQRWVREHPSSGFECSLGELLHY